MTFRLPSGRVEGDRMSGSALRDRHRRQLDCGGLPGRCSLFVPALLFGAWTAAAAADGGAAEGR